METRFYQTQAIDLQWFAQALMYEYQAQGYEAQQAGTPEQVLHPAEARRVRSEPSRDSTRHSASACRRCKGERW